MKRLSNLMMMLAILSLGLVACNQDEENLISEDPALEATVVSEEQFDSDFEDALDIAFSAMDAELGTTSGRLTADERMICAERTKVDNTITVDFGEGCEGPAGRFRKGKIILTYTGKYFEPGAVISLTFEEFYLNDKKLEGTRTVTNLSASVDDYPKHNIKLAGGKITWPDGTTMTRETNRTRTWKRAANPVNDEIEVFGTAKGTNKNGVSYTSTVAEATPIIMKRACWASRVFVPVQGIKVIIRAEKPSVTIDYGDGNCDTMAAITLGERVINVDLKEVK
ncbi:MAG: hypothetical protein ACOCXH_11375 [Cyclobacteriaceae bacterium]